MTANKRDAAFFLFWPTLALRYLIIERFISVGRCMEVSCALDSMIPFCEFFVIPYVLWYVLIIGMHLYTFFYDREAFRKYSRYLIVVFSISTVTYLLFPTCQNLRPSDFPRDNFFTDIVAVLYQLDTSTNVCPSEHVIGSVAAFLAARNSTALRKTGIFVFIGIIASFTGISTVFVKQHSLVDVAAAIPVCIIGLIICKLIEKKTGTV